MATSGEIAKLFSTVAKALNVYYKPQKPNEDTIKLLKNWVQFSGPGSFVEKKISDLQVSLGGSQQKMLDFVVKDPAQAALKITNEYLSMVGYSNNGKDLDPSLYGTAEFGSINELYAHTYILSTTSRLTDAESVVKKDGQYCLNDFRNFYQWNGVLVGEQAETKALLEEYNGLTTSSARQQWLRDHESLTRGNFLDMVAEKRFFKPGDWFFMGESLVEYKGHAWLEDKIKNTKTFVLLIRPGPTHPFQGWIAHGYTIIGPNSLASWTVGAGSSKVPGMDYFNSNFARPMWTITKNWTAARANFEQLQKRGDIAQTQNFLYHVQNKQPDLLRASIYMGWMVGLGAPTAIWLNKLYGQNEPSLLDQVDPNEVVEVRAGTGDAEKDLSSWPFGTNTYIGQFTNMKRKEAEQDPDAWLMIV